MPRNPPTLYIDETATQPDFAFTDTDFYRPSLSLKRFEAIARGLTRHRGIGTMLGCKTARRVVRDLDYGRAITLADACEIEECFEELLQTVSAMPGLVSSREAMLVAVLLIERQLRQAASDA
jgi:hypothetical protein